ncbi:MAG: undecaprenyl/decaprenyl-phosphate alpha-N-acetylglucosaminyl 1-phosphate transferase [Solirubrobacteraceae bacterium]|jgi:UDP-GlcNAc:undecaprenyl-phosphate/decaprenyl-phosphate GlcNAc-1-phosphate transferase|nr:undecaprenyl/decaprenyl-phosphate alpha-N-acetylglucosaminyl 1-phosphate transferase [Solirubrobacteraceae bacterium]MDP4672776.1 undecaprenyl/decaprenyl-phosphate alpha-N-acetylglucosaminyl 1-phosphate transferase [Solirubrobacteraceae bacterium]MDP4921322.1 undecaprenyl/decaprenyl-phosphate alpha-N-acetylglucosaminyl 1-phosphate transferase [Solirubrobacteraceae bacterium]
MTERDAILAFAVAFIVAVALTPLTARLGRRVGAVDQPRERGLSEHPTPLLGGLAILAAVLAASFIFIDPGVAEDEKIRGILVGAILVTLVGALDDRFDLPAAIKFIGQIVAATIPVVAGVEVANITLPFIGAVDLGSAGAPLTVLGIVFVINVVNFSDGVDGLAAGVCAISAVAFSIIAFDLGRGSAAVLAAIIAGAAAGFLVFNFHPAKVFMGDAGSNLLGLLLACVAVEGAVKTQVVLALVFPLLVLAVPFLDTTFVVLKRLKYGRPVYVADQSHFHHRMNRIGFSQRKTVLYLYAWTTLVAGFAVALRFVPYSDGAGQLNLGWSLVLLAVGLLVLAASVYLVYVLEILKFRRLRERRLRRADPQLSEEELARDVVTKLETGQFDAVGSDDSGATQADP